MRKTHARKRLYLSCLQAGYGQAQIKPLSGAAQISRLCYPACQLSNAVAQMQRGQPRSVRYVQEKGKKLGLCALGISSEAEQSC